MTRPLLLLLLCWICPVSSWTSFSRPSHSRHLIEHERSIDHRQRLVRLSAHGRKELRKTDKASLQQPIYSMPTLYDLAFGYRDYEEEVNFLLTQHERFAGRPATSVLELAAGPARHSLTALSSSRSIQSAIAIDCSKEMAEYAQEIAGTDFSDVAANALDYRVDDMRTFSLQGKSDDDQLQQQVDTAWILLGSLQHLTENEDIIQCFEAVSRALTDDGTLIVELPHPRETFSMVECTRNGWKVPLDDEDGKEYGQLEIVWGDDDDEFDPIRQVRQFTVSMQVTGATQKDDELPRAAREVLPIRLFTAQEMGALAQCANMKVMGMFGALEEGIAIDDDAAFRMVCVFQKR